jgi:copper chaperone
VIKRRIEFFVTGMDCAGCAQRAVSSARRLDGVVEASADHTSGRVRVFYDPARVDDQAIVQQLAAAGFLPTEAGG